MKDFNIETEPASRPRWMVVDDNKDVLATMRAVLAHCVNVDVQCFHSPHAALATFMSMPKAFDLVITDLEMPDMSGIELGCRLWKLSPGIKVLLATGSEILTASEARQKGFCGMLRKPFPLASLRPTLEAAGVLKAPAEKNSGSPAALTTA